MASKTLRVVLSGDSRGAVKALDKVEGRMGRMGRAVGKATKLVAGLGIAMGVAAAGAAVLSVKRYAEFGDQIHKMSQRVGFSTEALSELAHAAELSGTDIGSLEKGLRAMQRNIHDAGRGLSTQTDALDALGVSIEQLQGKKPEEQFDILARALAGVKDETTQSALAQIFFGRSGTALLPILANGVAGMAAMRAEAHDLGIVMSEEDAAAAAEFVDNMTRLNRRLDAMKFALARGLIPRLIEFQEWLGPRLSRAGQWLADTFDQRLLPAIDAIGMALRTFTVPWLDRLRSVAGEAVPLIRDLGVVLGLLDGDGKELHPFAQWLEDNKETVKTVGALAAGVLAAWLAYKGILAVILTAGAIVAKAKLAWAALTLVLGAVSIPVLLIAAVIGVVVAALALLISTGGDVGLAMEKLGNVVGPTLTKIGDAVGALVAWVTEKLSDTETWEALGVALVAAWGAAVDFVAWAKAGMAKLVTWLVGQLTNIDNWKAIGSAFSAAFGVALDFVVWAVKGMDKLVAWLITEATEAGNWKALGTALLIAFGAAINFVVWVSKAYARLQLWVGKQLLDTDNWKALGTALLIAFGAAINFVVKVSEAYSKLQSWLGEAIIGSATWAALGEAITEAFKGGLNFLLAGKNAAIDFVNGLLEFFASNSAIDMGLDVIAWLTGGVSLGSFNPIAAAKKVIPGFQHGGIVRARPGGRIVRVGEGGQDEAIVPLGRGSGGGGSGAGGTTVINLYIDATGGDPNRIADVLFPALQRLDARGSFAQFSFAGG